MRTFRACWSSYIVMTFCFGIVPAITTLLALHGDKGAAQVAVPGWAALLLVYFWLSRLDEQGKDCVSPDITFSISPYHFTATISERRSEIDVELCVPKSGKLLGLVPLTSTKFFHFKRVSRQRFEELLRAFFSVPQNEQFQWFSRTQNV